jgi:16S rRNA (cytosine1402-N4)-methyltransferase
MTTPEAKPHTSVMAEQMLEFFSGSSLKVFVEGTLGAGGHARCLLEAHPEIDTYIGFDQDPEALQIAKEVLSPWKNKVHFVHGNFKDFDKVLEKMDIQSVDGFFLTLGYRPCN